MKCINIMEDIFKKDNLKNDSISFELLVLVYRSLGIVFIPKIIYNK